MPPLTLQDRTRRAGILCCHFVRNVTYYRVGHDEARNGGQFWITVDGNFLDIAVLEWCKIFADERGEHHWKEIISTADQGAFFSDFLVHLGIDEARFNQCKQEMRIYRDKFIAHLDQENTMNIPVLDIPFKSTCYLFEYIRGANPAWFTDAQSISDYCRDREREVTAVWQKYAA